MKKIPFFQSLKYASKGLVFVLKNERNFQIEMASFFINIFLIFYLKINTLDTILILLLSLLVLIAEILNTAIEKFCDFVEPNFNPKIGIIKDISAAAVLLASIFALVVGVIIYYPYVSNFLLSK